MQEARRLLRAARGDLNSALDAHLGSTSAPETATAMAADGKPAVELQQDAAAAPSVRSSGGSKRLGADRRASPGSKRVKPASPATTAGGGKGDGTPGKSPSGASARLGQKSIKAFFRTAVSAGSSGSVPEQQPVEEAAPPHDARDEQHRTAPPPSPAHGRPHQSVHASAAVMAVPPSSTASAAVTEDQRSAPLLPLPRYDPVGHACWRRGEAAPYLHLALCFAAIDGTTKRLRKSDALTNMFRRAAGRGANRMGTAAEFVLRQLRRQCVVCLWMGRGKAGRRGRRTPRRLSSQRRHLVRRDAPPHPDLDSSLP